MIGRLWQLNLLFSVVLDGFQVRSIFHLWFLATWRGLVLDRGMSVVLGTIDTIQGYVEAEEATRFLDWGYWTCGCTEELDLDLEL
jgi:hypothetical protein